MLNPFDPNASFEIARAQIRAQGNAALIKGAAFTAALGVFGMVQIGILMLLGRDGFELPFAFATTGAVVSLVMRSFARRGRMSGPTKYLIFGALVSTPSAFLLASPFMMPGGAATYLNGPNIIVYIHILIMSRLLLDERLSMTMGGVAAAGYGAAWLLGRAELGLITAPDPVMQQDLTEPGLYAIKACMIFFGGGAVAIYAKWARNVVLSTVSKAYERGNYTLIESIGHGGMGEVWRAEHQMLARKAAVKLIRADMLGSMSAKDSKTLLRRFEREAQATAALRSPHTIEIYDFGLADDGTFYYVMELLDGLDLQSLVERHGPMRPERALHVLAQICDSLGEAHHAGLVHRDIKPANIFVCRYGLAVDFVKVLDFGLVKDRVDVDGVSLPASASSDAGLTQIGGAVGTPAYMPPEVVAGLPEVDHRADLYSVGCVAHWLLTGQLVFEAPTAGEMALRHLEAVPDPPSACTELELPDGLDEIVLRCLNKEAADRPGSAGELAEQLAGLQTRAQWTAERAEKWWARTS